MTDHLPLLIFPKARPIKPKKGKGFPPGMPHLPDRQTQINRSDKQFTAIEKDFADYKASVASGIAGLEPETVLVIETVGSVDDFKQAVESAGLEWLGEWELDAIDPTEDFYKINSKGEKTNKPLTGRMFLSMGNEAGLKEILSLWKRWKEKREFPYGKSKWKDVFKQLLTIRRWGVEETLRETGMIDRWQDLLGPIESTQTLAFQIELFYRRDSKQRKKSEEAVTQLLALLSGRVISPFFDLKEIAFHAVKAELPAASIKRIVDELKQGDSYTDIRLLKFPGIMYFRPSGQSFVLADDEEGRPADFPDSPAESAPVAALLDGVPLLKHKALQDRIAFDDLFDLEQHYLPGDRKHGTSMLSLIIHGDLGAVGSEPLSRKIYCIPIMQPDSNTQNRNEHIPEHVFLEDRIHRAVLRMFESTSQVLAQAPEIKIINLSICDPERPFIHTPSPWARLLDWLSWKYRVLFCVSIGNYTDEIDIGISHSEFEKMPPDQQVAHFLDATSNNLSSRRILSPAESLNALSVGALHTDKSGDYPSISRTDLLPNQTLFSPISRFGHGFRKSIKPEILFPGGRQLFKTPFLERQTCYEVNPTTTKPGQEVASDSAQQGMLSNSVFTRGTSNATALATRGGIQIYDMLCQLRGTEEETIPNSSIAILIKALLVHGAQHGNEVKQILTEALKTQENSHKIKEIISRYIGYGAANIERVLNCTEQRATVLGYADIRENEIHEYSFPLPIDLSQEKLWRRLSITLAWFSPINPSHRNLREAKLHFEPAGANWDQSALRVKRQDVDHNQVRRGTVQHEVLEAKDQIAVFQDKKSIGIRVVCKKDATDKMDEIIPYGLAVTLEVKEDIEIKLYQKIKARLKLREPVGIN